MEHLKSNPHFVDMYAMMLRSLSVDDRLELISKLSQSIKEEHISERLGNDRKVVTHFTGIWADEDTTAEELIQTIRMARTSTRTLEDW